MVDLDSLSAVGAVEEQQLGVLRHGAPGVDHLLADALAAVRALRPHLQPLVAWHVLAAHYSLGSSLIGGGGAHPGLPTGLVALGASGAAPSAAMIAARVRSAIFDGARSGYARAS